MKHYPYCDYCGVWGHPDCQEENKELLSQLVAAKELRKTQVAQLQELRAQYLAMQMAVEALRREPNAPRKEDPPTRNDSPIGDSQNGTFVAQIAKDMPTLSKPLPTQTSTGVSDDCVVGSVETEEDLEDDFDEPKKEEQFEELKEEPELFVHQVDTMPLPFSLGMVHENVEQQFGAFTGMLAKWHKEDPIKEEVTEVPSYTISQEEIHLFEEDGTKGDTRGKEDSYDMGKGHVILERPYWIRTTLPVDMVVLWSKNAGSFKVYKRRWK